MSRPLVTFISDFGLDDWFVGVVHAVIHERCPEAAIVDLTHQVPPGAVERAAFVLEAAMPDVHGPAVHLVVVDPGVGTTRRAIAVRARGALFVAPDNGVLEWALADPRAEVREITARKLFREPVSRTFHGRDVFAPVAAALAGGFGFAEIGPVVKDPVRIPDARPRVEEGELHGHVVHVDRFGNVLTNVTLADLEAAFVRVPRSAIEVVAGGRVIRGLAGSYGDAPVGSLVAVVGSSGRLEIAQSRGDASQRLGLSVRDEIRVRAGHPDGISHDTGRARFER
ncbi:MAG: S-adenosyl-l-methionine hydroxide adenosyltransferase family protein [Candidatus Eisenbacteria bacterium]